jgi:branched-chain amino acid transport system permease protein
MKKSTRKTIGILLIVAASIIFPLFNSDKYLLHLVSYSMIWVIMTQGLNVIQGLTGYISIAQATFFGIGAYVSALLSIRLGLSFWISAPLGILATVVTSFFIGVPSLKTKGHYFSIMTMAFGVVVWALMATLKDLTGGTSGLPNIPVPTSILGLNFSDRNTYYYMILFFTILTVLFTYRLKDSKTGRALVVIRENEQLAQAIGISLPKYKIKAFVIAATLGGLAGVLYAHYSNFINPVPFSIEYSKNAILAVIMGGVGTITGPIIGSFILIFLPEYLRIAESFRLVMYSLMLILITIFMPKGIVHAFKVLWEKIKELFAKRKQV